MKNNKKSQKQNATPAKGALPKLRFPEFKNAPEWEEKCLRDVAELIDEMAGTNKYTLMSVTSGVGLVPQIEKFGREIAGNQYKNYYVIKKEDFAYNKSSTKQYPEGYISMLVDQDEAALPNSIFTCFRIVDENTYPQFLNHLFHANFHGVWLRRFISVGARAHGSLNVENDDFFRMPIKFPPFDEQQKIADGLSSIDELIAVQTQKLEKLKDHKKGLMRQLFPAEGETVPKLRFPEFRNAPEWEEKSLGSKTIKVGSGVTPLGGESNYKRMGRPFIRSQNVGWGNLILDDVAFIDDATHSTFSATEILEGDVLLNITGASIGRSAVANAKIQGGNVNQHVCIIRTKKVELNPYFLNQYLLSSNGQKQIDNFQAGGNRQGLNFSQIRSFSVPLPSLPDEQQKIADCLSSLDELVALQAQKIEKLKAHKKGLVQQLFPSAAEVGE